MILEACVETLAEALRAQELGANRIELCGNLDIGGTTPSKETVVECAKLLNIPVMVMIRPRGGNFIYTPAEVKQMLAEIRVSKASGANGIVTGVLTSDGEVDLKIMKILTKEAKPLEITFHKAIDDARNIPAEITRLRNAGIQRVLTSGGARTALEGVKMLNAMIGLAAGKITIIAAGRITASNLPELSRLIHTDEFHGRKIVGELTR